MSKTIIENSEQTKVYKVEEFEAFIKAIKETQIAHWQDIARAIGVDNNTITAWRKLPEAQEAIREGLAKSLEGMGTAGRKDWRMYHEKYKMLTGKDEADSVNPILVILAKYGGGKGQGLDDIPRVQDITSGSSQDSA